ncbi:hypothetical protein Pint_28715 [Pistacia integerrima]|uniref:Uncharacterized protein n=1 Tax=Pistacia integerrima TaxID=434235 RepID=A0ACC0YTK3_9ROSI|nr:hypothetical protein Pint_28715 [Pistacia integerrima]
MGRLLHFFDFNQSSMARKILAHKKHADGLEAPRNSLELQVENSNTYPAVGDVPYSYPLEEHWSKKSSYPTETSMKKLINEEISKQSNTRQSAPSIVARLNGDGRTSSGYKTYSSRHLELDSIYPSKDRDADRWSNGENFGRPRPREHPQEEELQKFKKEFEAWQAARFRECSKIVDFDSMPRQWLVQENLNREKKAIYANSRANSSEKLVESKSRTLKSTSYDRDGLQHHRHKVESFPIEQKESTPLRSRSKSVDFQQSSLLNYEEKLETASTKIVILKPGPDKIYDHDESWTSSMGTLEERSSIEDFLEEIAQHIAKHVRESVTRDLGMNLLRSESTRSYRSEIQFNGPGSPEFINRDTRRFLSERLRNVLKRETHSDAPQVVSGRSRSSLLDNGRVGLKQSGDTSMARNELNRWEIERNEQEMQTRSFRHGDDNGVLNRELSPRNLIRSLSAPVSGTSFGQLLLEDRHILTGAQIRRKHEAIDNVLGGCEKKEERAV